MNIELFNSGQVLMILVVLYSGLYLPDNVLKVNTYVFYCASTRVTRLGAVLEEIQGDKFCSVLLL